MGDGPRAKLASRLGSDELLWPIDVDALIASLSGPSAHEELDDAEASKKDQVQQITFDVMKAETEAEARKLAKHALRLAPDCIDALVLMNAQDASTRKVRI